jgi:aromatic-amino-acid transaminase
MKRPAASPPCRAIGGTGGLKIGADFLKKLSAECQRCSSRDPSWENHRALFTQRRLRGRAATPTTTPPSAASTSTACWPALNAAPARHHRRAARLLPQPHRLRHHRRRSGTRWSPPLKAKNLTPFLDMAYQGFGHGIQEDGAVIGKFVAAGMDFFVSTSFSKSFSLYGERVGGLSVLCQDKEEAGRVLSQLKIVIRTNYSNPPTHGGAVVAAVLGDPELRAQWEKELGEMRVRIKAMRQKLVDGLKAAGVKQDMSFITSQIGMFSYSGLSKDQMVRLRSEFGVYGTDTGRMCVAALNSKNIDHVCQSIAKVVG